MASAKQTVALPQSNRVRLVVASSVMLTFISFWRAAAIVLNDLGSSAFYAGGLAEEAVGKAAPWLILSVVFFAYAVRAVYVESCSMFTRGGVYRIVKEALGSTFAKVSVSALDVRLRPDRPHLRCLRRPIHRRNAQRPGRLWRASVFTGRSSLICAQTSHQPPSPPPSPSTSGGRTPRASKNPASALSTS